MIGDLRQMARALNGNVVGDQVRCPGPGRGPLDDSLSVRISAASPTGWIAHSACGDDFFLCRDHMARLLATAEGRP
jgi:putative DNA primase/helicase